MLLNLEEVGIGASQDVLVVVEVMLPPKELLLTPVREGHSGDIGGDAGIVNGGGGDLN